MNILVLTDNEYLYLNFKTIANKPLYEKFNFFFFYSPSNEVFKETYTDNSFQSLDVTKNIKEIIAKYDVVLSLHCKQIFPKDIVNSLKCINIHPGLNPYNRGWFPHVFSMIDNSPVGVTIHEMDEKLDHGPIIAQKELQIFAWETSFDVYCRLQELELKLLQDNLLSILTGNYNVFNCDTRGTIHNKKDFNDLYSIDLNKTVTFKQAIDYFRAMTFNGHNNAYFYDDTNQKIYVEIHLNQSTRP